MSIGTSQPGARPRLRARADRRGTAILPALVLVVMMATLSMVFVQVSLSKNKEQRVSVDSKRAFYMAEAGLAEGFNGLCLGKSGNVASEDLPAEFGGGLFWTVATELGNGRVTLQSTGLCGAGRATLSLTCERRSDNVGALGFFGGQGITVEPGALIDSYDSRLGTYLSQALLAPFAFPGARVGGNSDITVQGSLLKPTAIFGDVNPGPLGTVLRTSGTVISGSQAPSPASVPFPAVKAPVIASRGDVVVAADMNLVTGAHGVGKLKISTGHTLELVGPLVLVAEQVLVATGGNLRINATDGPVKLFVRDAIKFQSGSTYVAGSDKPHGVSIQVSGTNPVDVDLDGVVDAPVDVEGTGRFYGSIYAPTAQMSLPAGFEVFGSVVADSLTLRTGGKLHFDRAFAAGSTSGGTQHLLGWHIVELPNVPIVKLRFDALAEILRRGITPRKPDQGHFDIGVAPY